MRLPAECENGGSNPPFPVATVLPIQPLGKSEEPAKSAMFHPTNSRASLWSSNPMRPARRLNAHSGATAGLATTMSAGSARQRSSGAAGRLHEGFRICHDAPPPPEPPAHEGALIRGSRHRMSGARRQLCQLPLVCDGIFRAAEGLAPACGHRLTCRGW